MSYLTKNNHRRAALALKIRVFIQYLGFLGGFKKSKK